MRENDQRITPRIKNGTMEMWNVTFWNSGNADNHELPQADRRRMRRKSSTERKSKRYKTWTEEISRTRSRSSWSNLGVEHIFLCWGNTREIAHPSRCENPLRNNRCTSCSTRWDVEWGQMVRRQARVLHSFAMFLYEVSIGSVVV